MADEISLYTENRPGFYPMADIYDPDTGQGNVVPKVKSLVIDAPNGGHLYWVKAVNSVTHKVTYELAKILITDENAGDQISVVSYGNDTFRIYTDSRNNPTRLQPDSRLVVYGVSATTYRLVMDRGGANEKTISRYYDAGGNYTTDRIPMAAVLNSDGSHSGMMYATPCHTLEVMASGTPLTMEIFNDHGALIATISCFSMPSAILNETPGYRPIIEGMEITSTQMRGNNEIFIYENQDPDSLNFTVTLVYDDGQSAQVAIDSQKCFIYGLEDFVASWSGLRQTVLVKYYLSADEPVDPALTTNAFISAEIDLVVIPNELAAGVKISVLPQWSIALSQYVLRYFMYTTDRTAVKDVSAYVTIDEGIFVGNLYSTYQTLTLAMDMSQVAPTTYSEPVIHRQTVSVRLQPQAALERYLTRDTMNSALVYGVDSPTTRRPIIQYDSVLEQYFIPSGTFLTLEGFLTSFYYNATPPYPADQEASPIAPTHFSLRDPNSGQMLVAAPIPVEDYTLAFSIIGTPAGRYAGSMVLVEFSHEIDVDTTLILFGSPVDVYAGTYVA